VAADVATHISKCGEDVIAQAEAQELDTDEVRRVLVEAGLAVERVVEPEPEVDVEVNVVNDVNLNARISAIEGTLDGVATRLDALIRLAEGQFGSLNI